MKRVICDKCERDCGDTYYTIDITSHPSDGNELGVSLDVTSQNFYSIMHPMHLCGHCKDIIDAYVNNTSPFIANNDVVPVVRCKDCCFSYKLGSGVR